MAKHLGLGVLLVVGLTACHVRPEPVPVRAAPGVLASLAGDWVGVYEGDQSGRSGTITFRITERGDSAFGDVMMVPAGGGGLPLPADAPAEHLRHVGTPQMLRIAFVALSGRRVRGTLEPYIAPDCRCLVHTAFTGALAGDVVRGTFVTRTTDGMEQTGRWRVSRQRQP